MKPYLAGFALLLSACNANLNSNRNAVSENNGITDEIQSDEQRKMDEAVVVCRDNVEYLSFDAYASTRTYIVHMQPSGIPFTCN